MITSPHGFLRATDDDDAIAFHQLYNVEAPRFALLDLKREPLDPTLSEIRETLGSKEAKAAQSFTLENPSGEILGFLALRGLNAENGICELAVLMVDEAHVHEPSVDWATDWVLDRAFATLRVRRVTIHTLCRETHLCNFLAAHGFTCEGRQREVVFSQGRWHDLYSFAATNPAFAPVETAACP